MSALPNPPILYSFRRCPYAMRARMALAYAGIVCEHREIVLRNKPAAMLTASPKGTVPVLVLPSGQVLDESLGIMDWALTQAKLQQWLRPTTVRSQQDWLQDNDGPFKKLLDKYKYADRHPAQSAQAYREQALPYLAAIDSALHSARWLHGDSIGICDIALFPFVRQFAMVDAEWFSQCTFAALKCWLEVLLHIPLFVAVMKKYKPWKPEDPPTFSATLL